MGQVLWIIKNKIKALYLQGTYSLVGKTNHMYKTAIQCYKLQLKLLL